jgi:hypothetical protein
MDIQYYDEKHGALMSGENALITFEIIKRADQVEIEKDKAGYIRSFAYGEIFNLNGYAVASYGRYNNMPGELRILIRDNSLLPEILKKQSRFMYGHGPCLYRKDIDGKKVIRVPLPEAGYEEVWKWLRSWRSNGLAQDFESYLKLVIQEYYYTEGIFSKWHYNLSRRIGGKIPIRGLEYLPSTRVRLAKEGYLDEFMILEDEELDKVLYGRWDMNFRFQYTIYDRFNSSDPLRFPVAVNYTRDFGFGEEVYSYPTFYYGLKEWIKGANLNPKYINSYLKNSLSAKLHVLIPHSWIQSKENTLKKICEENQQRKDEGKELITSYDGVENIGIRFDYALVQKIVDVKLKALTDVLTGEGENQGKTFISRKFRTEHGVEEWEFKEIPVKYSEFIKSIIEFDKRTVEVILSGKGLDPSISNVSKDGIFQSSGSNSYYNYLIYMNSLPYAEDFICQDINLALAINFPRLRREGVQLGFFRNIPERQEQLPPDDRLNSTATQ